MRRNPWLQEAPLAACCVLALCLPLPFIYPTLCIWLLIVTCLLSGRYRETWQALKTTKAYWLWGIYFALYAVSYFYTADKAESEFDTVSKLSFVLLPLFAGAGTNINIRGLSAIMLSFITGVVGAGIFCIIQAYTFWKIDGQLKHFFYHELPRGLDANAAYMSWYVVTALAALMLFPWRESGKRWMVRWRWPVILFCTGLLTLLSSRLPIIMFLLLVIPAYGIRYFRLRNRSLLIPALAGTAVILLFGILIRTHNPIRKRFSEIMHPDITEVMKENYHQHGPSLDNLTLRLFVWRIALENMNEHHLWLKGAGNGDVHKLQNERIAAHGVWGMHEETPRSNLYNVNLHNMYFQSLITLGIPGFCIFLLIAVGPLFYLRRSVAAWFFALFHIMSIFFMLQESALQTQAGVVFYCFFSAIFWQAVKRPSKIANPASQ